MAGLPGSKAIVGVGPRLSCKGPRSGLTLSQSLAAVEELSEATSSAVTTLVGLLGSKTEMVQLNAAKAILSFTLIDRPDEREDAQPVRRERSYSDERARVWILKLIAEGFFASDPSAAPIIAQFEQELTAAEAEPSFNEVPTDYLPRLGHQERLDSWRRYRFRQLGVAQFQLLELTQKLLQANPDWSRLPPL